MQKTQAVFEAQLTNKLVYWFDECNCCIQMKVSISDHKIPKESKDTLSKFLNTYIDIQFRDIKSKEKKLSILKKRKYKIGKREKNKLMKFCQKKTTAIILELYIPYMQYFHIFKIRLFQSLPAALQPQSNAH